MKRIAFAAALVAIVLAFSSCYWTPEATTGSLVFTLPAISARTIDMDPPAAAQEDKDKDNPGGGKPDKDKDTPDGGKPDKNATEATHVRIYLLAAGAPYSLDGGND